MEALRDKRPSSARSLMRIARRIRRKNKLNTRDQAQEVGVAPATWNRLELHGACSVNMLIQLHYLTGLSFERLLGLRKSYRRRRLP